MSKVISLQGSNGSGKTTIVYNILNKFPHRPIYGISGPRYPEAYEVKIGDDSPLYILGPYHTPTGGTDWLGDHDTIIRLIQKYAVKGNVLFEGLITSGCRGRVGEVLETFGKDAAVLFIDTPMETCIERVKNRRSARGNGKEFNPNNLIKKYQAVRRTRKRYQEADIVTIMDVSSDNGDKIILGFICGYYFDCPVCKAPGASEHGCDICGSGPAG